MKGHFVAAAVMLLGIAAAVSVKAQDNEIYPDRIQASSTLYEEGYDHGSYNLVDWDYSTAWVEAADGNGIGEYVDYFFPTGTIITAVSVLPGYCKSDYAFYNNSAPGEISVQSGTASEIVFLWDLANNYSEVRNPLLYELPHPIICDGTLRFTIKDIRSGSKYQDTCISEIHAYGQKAAGTSVMYGQADSNMPASRLSAYAYRVYNRISGYNDPSVPYVSLDMLSADGYAFLLYWYQYNNYDQDNRIVSDGELNYASEADLKEMLAALTGSSPDTAWDRFLHGYVEYVSGGRCYMSGTGDFGDAGPYYFTDASDQGTVDGVRQITGTVKVENGQNKSFQASFVKTDSPTMGGWQLKEIYVN